MQGLLESGCEVSLICSHRNKALSTICDGDLSASGLSNLSEVCVVKGRSYGLRGWVGTELNRWSRRRQTLSAVDKMRRKPDVVLTMMPRGGQDDAQVICRLYGCKHAIWLLDMQEAMLAALGRTPGPNGGPECEIAMIKRADRVITIGRCMADLVVRSRVSQSKVLSRPLWWTPDMQAQSTSELPTELTTLKGRFVVMYAGNFANWHGVEAITSAIRLLAGNSNLHFVFAGGGYAMRQIREAVDSAGARNCTFLDFVPADSLCQLIKSASVHLVSLRPEVLGTCVPSKLLNIMRAGRPSIFIGPEASEAAMLLRESGGGWHIDEGSSTGLAELLEALSKDPHRVAEAGYAARSASDKSSLTACTKVLAQDLWLLSQS